MGPPNGFLCKDNNRICKEDGCGETGERGHRDLAGLRLAHGDGNGARQEPGVGVWKVVPIHPRGRGAEGTPTPQGWRCGYCSNSKKWEFSKEVASGCCSESTAALCHSRGHGQHLWEVSCGSRGTGHGERRDRVPPGSGTVCLEDSGLAKDAALAQAMPLCITDWLESKPGVSRCLQEVAW